MAGKDPPGLPEFDRPPVIETILGVHFKPIRSLTTAHLGLFWQHLGRKQWPTLRELGSIVPQIERFDVSPSEPLRFMLRATERPEIRIRLNNADGSRVVQIQPDLLQTHWVRAADTAYPRYSKSTKPGFLEVWDKFTAFLQEQGLDLPSLVQWEVTYINRIPAGETELWRTPQDWASVFQGVLVAPAIPVGSIESARANYHYRLANDRGRLHVEVRHVRGGDGGPESIDVTLTARGRVADEPPATQDAGLPKMAQALSAGLDVGRQAIVNAFKAFGSKKALDFWGYKEVMSDA